MIADLYPKYFQKSRAFLYPLLGFNKKKHPAPVMTYLTWKNTMYNEVSKRKLVAVFQKEDNDAWRAFESDLLLTHKMLETSILLDEGKIAYVFNCSSIAADYDQFLRGAYSQFSTFAKRKLSDYYGIHTPEWTYIESFIYPNKYFKHYAELLNVEEEFLRNVGELCDPFDPEKETCLCEVPEGIDWII